MMIFTHIEKDPDYLNILPSGQGDARSSLDHSFMLIHKTWGQHIVKISSITVDFVTLAQRWLTSLQAFAAAEAVYST